jgi:hypothetical protein
MKAKHAAVTVALAGFSSVFKTMSLASLPDEQLRATLVRDITRTSGLSDPAVALAIEGASGPDSLGARTAYVAAMPTSVVPSLASGLRSSGARLEGVTVVPEAMRQLYASLDGSSETTAMLISLRSGPHIGFFVNGRLELFAEPSIGLDDEGSLDARSTIDQLDRSAIFLRQQARGAVATRLLLSAPPDAYESLASKIESHTGMHVVPLGAEIGSPETLVAFGAVIATHSANGLDLNPPVSTNGQGIPGIAARSLVRTTLTTAAAVAALWAGMQVLQLRREARDLSALQAQVDAALPLIERMRRDAQQAAIATDAQVALLDSDGERAAMLEILESAGKSSGRQEQLDSVRITRLADGLHVSARIRGGAAVSFTSLLSAPGGK